MSSLKIILLLFSFCVFVSAQKTPPPRIPSVGNRFGEKYEEALDAIFSIAVRLEALLANTHLKTSSNFLVSPLSMAVAVGELMLGARGTFQEQLHELLVIERPSHNRSTSVRHRTNVDLEHLSLHEQLGDLMQNLQHQGYNDESYTLKTASILFAQRNLKINDAYRTNVLRYYGTQIRELDFNRDPYGSQSVINTWVREATHGLIQELFPSPLPRYTSAILANAVYFKADWEVPFASEINKRGVFKTGPNSTVNVTYMIGEFDNYRYVENKTLGCRMVVVPYLNDEVSMYIIMPLVNNGKEYDINDFVQTLRSRDVNELISAVRTRKVTMVLPKMSLSNTISMIEPLKKYYSYKNTQNRAGNSIDRDDVETIENKVRLFQNITTTPENVNFDLGDISEDPRFRMNNIYQQMTLNVNEKGTEAAAISAGIVDYIMDSVVFRIDRPFLFFIRHEDTKATLFWGTIVDPTEVSSF